MTLAYPLGTAVLCLNRRRFALLLHEALCALPHRGLSNPPAGRCGTALGLFRRNRFLYDEYGLILFLRLPPALDANPIAGNPSPTQPAPQPALPEADAGPASRTASVPTRPPSGAALLQGAHDARINADAPRANAHPSIFVTPPGDDCPVLARPASNPVGRLRGREDTAPGITRDVRGDR